MKIIQLSRNKHCYVDNEDYAWLSHYKWHFSPNHSGNGYAQKIFYYNGKQKLALMHRLILRAPSNIQVDHINGNGLDNRKMNLRLCKCAQNQANRKFNKNNTSGYKGVIAYPSKANRKYWLARLNVNNRSIFLGYYNNVFDAAKAYNEGARKYFGEFAKLNELHI